ncbi:SDR family NAD(P)-dependent oxidoreductase [Rhodalgimonas zhirmunskyi]|uniref:SDR family NAD(P)-dependent oxidoreductase n=1 Tax=Rhodalgimonas zhirmunskyi TaxID=2964767 RepID=A0AAJ1UER9_9RHOB|nr:SDR family NAD(P)-dependent oxidoreductase [Rhodoalgimonas zhirmunskyi]MDQ2094637.1 SDR family NAD(P)-dependent oxidoreductase [Rhodoalgimonas zhirmunskyi]
MKRALIIGASGGIGAALVAELEERGVDVTGLSRADGFDLTEPPVVEGMLARLEPGFDLIFVASGILTGVAERPEKALKEITAEEMAAQFAVNTIGPALVLRHAARLLPRDRRGVFAALSARVGSIGDNRAGGWYSYRASKAALNQVIHTGAIELARSHKQAVCVALHPGTVATEFTADYGGRDKLSPEEAAAYLLGVLEGLGPEQTGQFFDWKGERVVW